MTAMLSYRHSQTARPTRTSLPFYRRLELRRQAGGHPMTLVTTLAVGTHTTAKTSRLPRIVTVSPARIRPQAAEGTNACTPPAAAPTRRQPVAYV